MLCISAHYVVSFVWNSKYMSTTNNYIKWHKLYIYIYIILKNTKKFSLHIQCWLGLQIYKVYLIK